MNIIKRILFGSPCRDDIYTRSLKRGLKDMSSNILSEEDKRILKRINR